MATTPVPLNLTLLNTQLTITDGTGKPTNAFVQNINNAFTNILVAFNALSASQANLQDLVDQIVMLTGLVQGVDGRLTSQSIVNSYITPAGVLSSVYDTTSMKANIVIADHTRVYTDGTTKPVTGATLGPFDPGSYYYVYYDDPTRHGGVETYQTSVNGSDAAQTAAGRHSVGGITLATSTGGGTGDDPGYPGVPRCVEMDSWMANGVQAGDLEVGDILMILNEAQDGVIEGAVRARRSSREVCYRITTASGITLIASATTPMTLKDRVVDIKDCLGEYVPVLDHRVFSWDQVVGLEYMGERYVIQIDAGDKTYAAGEKMGRYILTHNKPVNNEVPDAS